MKKVLFVLFLACSSYSFSENRLTIDKDGDVYDTNGAHYINEGSFWHRTDDGSYITMDCPPMRELINPSIPSNDEKYPGISRLECVIKKSNIEGDYAKVEGELPIIEDEFLQPIKPLSDSDKQSAINACYKFAAIAPPSVWGPYVPVDGHIGIAYFKLTYTWIGDTQVNGKVKYWGRDNRWVEDVYFQSYSFRTGHATASIYVTYIGLPTGAGVEGQVC